MVSSHLSLSLSLFFASSLHYSPMIRFFVETENGAVKPLPHMTMLELQGKLDVSESLLAASTDDHHSVPHESDPSRAGMFIGHIDEHPQFPNRRTLRLGTACVDGAAKTSRNPILVLRKSKDASAEMVITKEGGEDQKGDYSESTGAPGGEPLRTEVLREIEAREDALQGLTVDETYERLLASSGFEEKKEAQAPQEECNADGEPVLETFADWIDKHPQQLEIETHFDFDLRDAPRQIALPTASEPNERKRQRDGIEKLKSGTTSPRLPVKDYDIVGVVEDYYLFNSKPYRVFE